MRRHFVQGRQERLLERGLHLALDPLVMAARHEFFERGDRAFGDGFLQLGVRQQHFGHVGAYATARQVVAESGGGSLALRAAMYSRSSLTKLRPFQASGPSSAPASKASSQPKRSQRGELLRRGSVGVNGLLKPVSANGSSAASSRLLGGPDSPETRRRCCSTNTSCTANAGSEVELEAHPALEHQPNAPLSRVTS